MSQTPAAAYDGPPKISALAIASLACGIAGFCVVIIGPLLGIIFGAIALVQIGKSNGRLTGQGLAIGGIATSVVSMLASTCLLIGIMLPALGAARQTARTMQYNTNARAVAEAMIDYAATNDGRLPDAANWTTTLQPHMPDLTSRLESPYEPENTSRALAMNQALSGVRIADIPNLGNTVLVFEIAPGGPMAGGVNDLPAKTGGGSQSGMVVIAFADGSVKAVAMEDAPYLIWDPGIQSSGGPSSSPRSGFIQPQ